MALVAMTLVGTVVTTVQGRRVPASRMSGR